MKSKGTRTVKLADVHSNMYVRKALDEGWAFQLAELIDGGVEMKDPLEVTEVCGLNGQTGHWELINGRHRRWAYDYLGHTEVKVRVLEFDSEVEKITYAFNANQGGSLPPTAQDTEHTIRQLHRLRVSIKGISEMLAIPIKGVQKCLEDIKSKDKRVALRRGEELVRDQNYTVVKAAEEVGVKVEELKGFLGGHRRRSSEVSDLKRKLTKLQQSLSAKVGRILNQVDKQFDVGDLAVKDVTKIFAKVEGLQNQWIKTISDRKARFLKKLGENRSEE